MSDLSAGDVMAIVIAAAVTLFVGYVAVVAVIDLWHKEDDDAK